MANATVHVLDDRRRAGRASGRPGAQIDHRSAPRKATPTAAPAPTARPGATPSTLRFSNELLDLVSYAPTTDQVHERPLLVVPPHAHRHDVIDLSSQRSLVAHLVAQGQQVFVAIWRDATAGDSRCDLAAHVLAIEEAIDAITAATGSDDVNLCGVRDGGITAAAVVGHLAATSDERVATFTTLGTVLGWPVGDDVDRHDLVSGWVDGARARRTVSGRDLSRLLATLGHKHEQRSELGGPATRRAAFDAELAAWEAQPTTLSAELFADLAEVVGRDLLAHPGRVVIDDTKVDLAAVGCDTYVAGSEDRWSTWRSCYRTTDLLGGPTRFVLAPGLGAHALLCPADASVRTNVDTSDSAGDWMAGSVEQDSGWWSDWAGWLAPQSGGMRPAPRHAFTV